MAANRDIRHLQLLTTLSLSHSEYNALVGLHKLRSLQKLSILHAIPSAAPGQQVPVAQLIDRFDSLRCLEVSGSQVISQELAAIVAASTGLRSLTVLQFSAEPSVPGVSLHGMLQPLQQLRELILILPQYQARAPPADAGLLPAGLTALTKLSLHLGWMPEGVRLQLYHHTQLKELALGVKAGVMGDEVLEALAVCLPELERLTFNLSVSAAAAMGVFNSASFPRLQRLRMIPMNLTAAEQDQVRGVRPGLQLNSGST
jgi:hypothetical protein